MASTEVESRGECKQVRYNLKSSNILIANNNDNYEYALAA